MLDVACCSQYAAVGDVGGYSCRNESTVEWKLFPCHAGLLVIVWVVV
jgi:hypothetical protein